MSGQEKETTEDVVEGLLRSPARYLWAMLLARIYKSAPLACPHCGADMRIIAFVTKWRFGTPRTGACW